ncbi:MAG: amidohydrolase, partial [Lentisphaeria bacterium]|nr:amidohydrolase [Lentisphaeria bacterium]
MLTKDQMKQRVCDTIAAQSDRLKALGEDILRHPELGYRETRTSALVQDVFLSLGLPVRTGLAITGCRADLPGRAGGPRLAILGELDGIVVPGHPFADPATGASHACGHHAQICAL